MKTLLNAASALAIAAIAYPVAAVESEYTFELNEGLMGAGLLDLSSGTT